MKACRECSRTGRPDAFSRKARLVIVNGIQLHDTNSHVGGHTLRSAAAVHPWERTSLSTGNAQVPAGKVTSKLPKIR